MREVIRRAMAEADIRRKMTDEIDLRAGIDASFEREPGLEEAQREHLPLLEELTREYNAMVRERREAQRAEHTSFRMTMYQWGIRALGRSPGGEA